jgi:hypothetical protein
VVDVPIKDSILQSTKLGLSVPAEYDEFDFIITLHINTALSTLTQLGVGPVVGFIVQNPETTWDEFYGEDPRFSMIQSYIILKVRMLFDPPSTGPLMEAMTKQIDQLEWRINAEREYDKWNLEKDIDGGTPSSVNLLTYDGGTP